MTLAADNGCLHILWIVPGLCFFRAFVHPFLAILSILKLTLKDGESTLQ